MEKNLENDYADGNFWNKVKIFAIKAGKEVFEKQNNCTMPRKTRKRPLGQMV